MTNSFQRGASMALAVVLGLAALAQAQTFTTLYNFTGGSDGNGPDAGVIQDPFGNLYGTTSGGGDLNCSCGVVFKLDGTGIDPVLHSFSYSDGAQPFAPVARDKSGNLYGTTEGGGAFGNFGVVFKIDTAGKETVLHSFGGRSDEWCPDQGLVRDKAGNWYGTTNGCGPDNGTIFKIDNEGHFAHLYSFTGSDGASPASGHLTMDKFGNLYGVTENGGSTACSSGCGVLYELSTKGTFTVLHGFGGGTSDGCYPGGTVVQDSFGNLYGTAGGCGSSNLGTIWKVSQKGEETILHNFTGGTSDGCGPSGGVTWDSKGNLYGLTYGCGANGGGALYKWSAKGKLTLLHSFDKSDGYNPVGEVLRTDKGTLYGTASLGGTGDCFGEGCGTVWSYVP